MGVAQHTRVWGPAGDVFIGKVIDDVIPEFLPDINDIMRKAQAYRYVTGIVYGIQATATGFFLAATGGGIIPGLHGHAHHFIALLMQHHRGYRRIDTATHGDQYPA
jgi:hypothetical protein